ncbi:hypothetical protein DL96DRAFT_659020 [Flagelloscypha sp. PMI_526]|nr:hypothetical protein DL96DRAFT_659020 [Flagelloscypha sp. PMI_526]
MMTEFQEALSSLSSDSSFRDLVDQTAWMGVGIEERGPIVWQGSRLSAQADRSGKMHVVLSSNSQNQNPALRYVFNFPPSTLEYGPKWINKFYNLSLSQWVSSGSLVGNVSRFYGLVDATARSYSRLSPFVARPSLQMKVSILSRESTQFVVHPSGFIRGITRYSSVTHIQLPTQSIPVVWNWYSVPQCISPSSVPSGHRISVPPNVPTILFKGSCSTELFDPCIVFMMRHMPTIWRHAQALFPRESIRPKVEYEYPRSINVHIQVDFLYPQPNPLFLFTCTELLLSADGSFDPSRLFYISLDPLGRSRLSESDLERRGMVFTVGTYIVAFSKTMSDVSVQALADVATEVAKWSDPPIEFKPSFQGWPKHPRARCSSVDRYLKYPHSRMWRYQHGHRSSHPFHDVLCDLITQEECICSETEKMLLTAGYSTYRSRYGPDYDRDYCSCYEVDSPAQRKRRRPKSVDRARRIFKSIAFWIALMDVAEMDEFEFRYWYLEPSLLSMQFIRDAYGPKRSGITPWTVLMEPSQAERGRSRNGRERISVQ